MRKFEHNKITKLMALFNINPTDGCLLCQIAYG